ncbi:MAG: tyrosine-type recombinase/integrase [Bacteroidetes bacterium]|nr:tyrosine-type recombinase/integrase [Bacteroidota bacterium]
MILSHADQVVQGKGNKDRYTILSQKLWSNCDFIINTSGLRYGFLKRVKGVAMSERTIKQVFKNALGKSGITKKVSIHSLRHSFATHLMEQGVSLAIIQQLLGHKSLRTTSIYLHVQQYALNKVKSPLDFLAV